MKKMIDEKIIESGGGHNMAAGFIMRKHKLIELENFILNDYLIKNKNLDLNNTYDSKYLPMELIKISYAKLIK